MKSDSTQERPPAYFTEKFNEGDRNQHRFIQCYSDISVILVNELSLQLKNKIEKGTVDFPASIRNK